MKKVFLLPVLALLLFTACKNDSAQSNSGKSSTTEQNDGQAQAKPMPEVTMSAFDNELKAAKDFHQSLGATVNRLSQLIRKMPAPNVKEASAHLETIQGLQEKTQLYADELEALRPQVESVTKNLEAYRNANGPVEGGPWDIQQKMDETQAARKELQSVIEAEAAAIEALAKKQ